MARTSGNPRARRELGDGLRDAAKGKMTSRELGNALGIAHTTVVRWWNGDAVPSFESTVRVLDILGVDDLERERLTELARCMLEPSWVTPGVHRYQAAHAAYEHDAVRIHNVQPLRVPGLLQVEEYARWVLAGGAEGDVDERVAEEELDEQVRFRLDRQAILTRDDAPEFFAVIGEVALRYPECEKSVAAKQCRRLLEWSKRDNVTIQLLPLDNSYKYSVTRAGAFVALEFPKARPIVQLEHYRSTATLTDRRDVKDYLDAAEKIRREEAMRPEETTDLIAELADKMERTT